MEANESLPVKLLALPEPWVDGIFGRMSTFYGSLFSDRWRDTNLVEVKRVWAEELASFSDNPECFGLALKEMVSCKFPPTLPEFVEMCRTKYKRPQPVFVALTHVKTYLSKEETNDRLTQLRKKFPKCVAAINGMTS